MYGSYYLSIVFSHLEARISTYGIEAELAADVNPVFRTRANYFVQFQNWRASFFSAGFLESSLDPKPRTMVNAKLFRLHAYNHSLLLVRNFSALDALQTLEGTDCRLI
jgi:hypothetical protein